MTTRTPATLTRADRPHLSFTHEQAAAILARPRHRIDIWAKDGILTALPHEPGRPRHVTARSVYDLRTILHPHLT